MNKETHAKSANSCTKNQQLWDVAHSFRTFKTVNRSEMSKIQKERCRSLGRTLFEISDEIDEPEGAPKLPNADRGAYLEQTTEYRYVGK